VNNDDEDSIHPHHTTTSLNKKEKRILKHELFIERMWRILFVSAAITVSLYIFLFFFFFFWDFAVFVPPLTRLGYPAASPSLSQDWKRPARRIRNRMRVD